MFQFTLDAARLCYNFLALAGSSTAAATAKPSFFSATFGSKKSDQSALAAAQALGGLRRSVVALALHILDDARFTEAELESMLTQLFVHRYVMSFFVVVVPSPLPCLFAASCADVRFLIQWCLCVRAVRLCSAKAGSKRT